MVDKIGILGANGVYGRHLIPRLTVAGIPVRALVRRPEAAGMARACGAEIRVADIFDSQSLAAGLDGCDICLNLATSLPGPSGRGDFESNDRVRREGVPCLIEACRRTSVAKLLQQSIALVGASGEQLADESAVFRSDAEDVFSRAVAAALDMEKSVRESELDWLILRGGLFYGPGTGFDEDWFARAAAGKLRLPDDGSDYVTLVHIADMAAATVAALAAWPSRQTLIVCDDAPARWRDVFGYIATAAGAPAPPIGGRSGFSSVRMSNARARSVLGWAPQYPDYRSGLAR